MSELLQAAMKQIEELKKERNDLWFANMVQARVLSTFDTPDCAGCLSMVDHISCQQCKDHKIMVALLLAGDQIREESEAKEAADND